jgi:hypothetical protein
MSLSFDSSCSLLIRQPQVVYDFFPDEVVILDLESGCYFSARDSSCQVWQWIVDGLSLGQMQSMVQDKDRESLRNFVAQLAAENLILKGPVAPVRETPTALMALVDLKLEKSNDMQELLMLDPIHEVDETGWPRAAV